MPLVMWPMGTLSSGTLDKALPHVAADLAVQFADGVGGAAEFQREHGHAERFVRVLRLHAAQGENVIERNASGCQIALQGVVHQFGREPVVARLHRRVRGENAFRLGQRLGLGKGFAGGHFFADEFQREERRVAFVHVERGRREAKRAQQAHAADAEQNFLHDARGAVAAINAAWSGRGKAARSAGRLVSSR